MFIRSVLTERKKAMELNFTQITFQVLEFLDRGLLPINNQQQCDQMDRLFVQNFAIYNNVKICPTA